MTILSFGADMKRLAAVGVAIRNVYYSKYKLIKRTMSNAGDTFVLLLKSVTAMLCDFPGETGSGLCLS